MFNAKEALEKTLKVRQEASAEQESKFQECLSIVNQVIEKAVENGEGSCVIHKLNLPEIPRQNFYDFLKNLGYGIIMYSDVFSVYWEKRDK